MARLDPYPLAYHSEEDLVNSPPPSRSIVPVSLEVEPPGRPAEPTRKTYYKRFWNHLVGDVSSWVWARDQLMWPFLVGVVVIILNLISGTYHDIPGLWLVDKVYLTLLGLFALWKLIDIPWKLDKMRHHEIEAQHSEITRLTAEAGSLKARIYDISPHLGCQGPCNSLKLMEFTVFSLAIANTNMVVETLAKHVRGKLVYHHADGECVEVATGWLTGTQSDLKHDAVLDIPSREFRRMVYLLQLGDNFYAPNLSDTHFGKGVQIKPGVWTIDALVSSGNCDSFIVRFGFNPTKEGGLSLERWTTQQVQDSDEKKRKQSLESTTRAN